MGSSKRWKVALGVGLALLLAVTFTAIPALAQKGSARKGGGSGGGMAASSSSMQILFESDWEHSGWDSDVPGWPRFFYNLMSYPVTIKVIVPSTWQVDKTKTYCYYGDGDGEYLAYNSSLNYWYSVHQFNYPLVNEVVCLVTRTDNNSIETSTEWIFNYQWGDSSSLPSLPDQILAPDTGNDQYNKILEEYHINDTSTLVAAVVCPVCDRRIYKCTNLASSWSKLDTSNLPLPFGIGGCGVTGCGCGNP